MATAQLTEDVVDAAPVAVEVVVHPDEILCVGHGNHAIRSAMA